MTPMRLPPAALDLEDGAAVRFRVSVDGIERDAFVVRHGGRLRAYLNACRHQARALDDGSGEFLDRSGVLVCRHHGARYDVAGGGCLSGPCAGGALTGLVVERRGPELWCTGVTGR